MPKTWQAMEKLYGSGKARAVGVSNFSTKKLADLLAVARVPPAVDQVECHPSWQQAKLRAFCRSNGVHFSVSQHCFKPVVYYDSGQFAHVLSAGVCAAREDESRCQ